jgi:hypothetical protein
MQMSILERLKKYIERPDILKYELVSFYNKFFYVLSNFIDPMPKRKRNEGDYDYFDRIDSKYGLRYYGYLRAGNVGRDVATTIKFINENYKRARDRKLLKRLFLAINKMENNNEEGYQRYLIRSQILKTG